MEYDEIKKAIQKGLLTGTASWIAKKILDMLL